MSIPLVASSPLIYQLSFAAGRELEEVQLAERMSLVLYLGWLPLIMGPSSGRSEIMFDVLYKSIQKVYSYLQHIKSFHSLQFGKGVLLLILRINTFLHY